MSGLSMVLPVLGCTQQLGIHDRTFYKVPGTSLVGKIKLARKVKDTLDCSFLCLEHGPFVCLSFNFRKANESGYYTCELSNSERYLESHNMQEQPSSDYYGTTAEVSYYLTFCKMGKSSLLNQTKPTNAKPVIRFCRVLFFIILHPLNPSQIGVDTNVDFFISDFGERRVTGLSSPTNDNDKIINCKVATQRCLSACPLSRLTVCLSKYLSVYFLT